MSRPRIVLDTNVLISAALKPQGQQALVIHLVAFRAVEVCVSEAVLAEYHAAYPLRPGVDLLLLVRRDVKR